MNISTRSVNRRHFLKAGALTFGALGMGSMAPFLQKSLAGDLPPGKKLLFIFLREAMDAVQAVIPYGDQGLLLSRRFYGQVGGYRDLPLMEDVDLVRRIGRSRLHMLPAAARTSAARYQLEGYWRRPARNLLCLGLYYLGLPPRQIAKVYE